LTSKKFNFKFLFEALEERNEIMEDLKILKEKEKKAAELLNGKKESFDEKILKVVDKPLNKFDWKKNFNIKDMNEIENIEKNEIIPETQNESNKIKKSRTHVYIGDDSLHWILLKIADIENIIGHLAMRIIIGVFVEVLLEKTKYLDEQKKI